MSDRDHVIPFERLPERFAESLENPPDPPVEPRPAATIVLMRDGAEGPEVLLLKRNRSAGFVPGAYVFPGGRVDGTDATPDVLERVDGLTAERAAERLGLVDGTPPAIAYYLAALREAFEETGILVGRTAEGSPPPTAAESEAVDAIRDDLMEDRIPFGHVLNELGCRVDGASVEYVAHWITPVPEPRRYDTRFFAAQVPPGATAIVDRREMTDAVWIAPRAALRRNNEGTLPMVFPTLMTLEQLAAFESARQALDVLGRQPVRPILPTLVVTPTGVALRVEEDEEE